MSEWEAGRELDAMVAERVFGFEWWRSSETGRRGLFPPGQVPEWFKERADMSERLCFDHPSHVPAYSTDIKDAWEVVEKMRARGYGVAVEDPACRGRWRVIFGIEERIKGMGNADTAPLAICKAALNAVSNSTP